MEFNTLPKTLKYYLKFINKEIDVPVTTMWTKGKIVWNIGDNNPYMKDGYVVLTNVDGVNIIPESLELLYVGSAEMAELISDVAGYVECNPYDYADMIEYINSWSLSRIADASEKMKTLIRWFEDNDTIKGWDIL